MVHEILYTGLYPLYGEMVETFIVSELLKRITHKGKRIGIFYWRDKTGHEIDLVLEHGQTSFMVKSPGDSCGPNSYPGRSVPPHCSARLGKSKDT
jgi:predicted AAA+ superfamily ATPase